MYLKRQMEEDVLAFLRQFQYSAAPVVGMPNKRGVSVVMKIYLKLLSVLACIAMPFTLGAAAEADGEMEDGRFTIAGKLSTLGPGVDASIGVTQTLGLLPQDPSIPKRSEARRRRCG